MVVMRRDGIGLPRAAILLATCVALLAGCGGSDEPAAQVLRLSVVTRPGVIEFDEKHLRARAGRIEFVLINGKLRGHNIRIHTGDECCHCQSRRGLGGDVRPLRLVLGLAAG
jgi:hypothetical protein